jgi:hypothetical protein
MNHAKTNYDKQMADAWQRCVEFNEVNPIGTPVRYLSTENPPGQLTITRSMAWALPSGQAVVMIKGQGGGVSLDHIEVCERLKEMQDGDAD